MRLKAFLDLIADAGENPVILMDGKPLGVNQINLTLDMNIISSTKYFQAVDLRCIVPPVGFDEMAIDSGSEGFG